MKRFSKVLLLTVVALAMVLNTCGIALAVEAPTVVVEEVVVKPATGVKKLVFTLTMPEGSSGITGAGMVFSFDNTVIQPVNKGSSNANVNLTTSNSAPKTPFKAWADPEDPANDNGANFSMASIKVAVVGTRTGVKLDTYNSDYPCDATSGMTIGEFYYKVKDGATPNSETFKLETEGEVYEALFPDLSTAYAINVSDADNVKYKYGTYSTEDTEAIAKPALTYEGSDITTGPTTYDVTVAEYANGYVKADAALTDVEADTVINFEFTPHMGYALTSLKINEVESINAVVNGRYALTVAADTTVAAEFTAVAADVDGDVFTASKVYDIAADADAALDKEKGASKLTFGKAVEVAGKTARNMGMEVQVKEGDTFVDYATPKGVGPKYRAHTPVNNQFGIRFFSFPAGTYRVRSYVDYEDLATGALGESIYGEYVEFTVE